VSTILIDVDNSIRYAFIKYITIWGIQKCNFNLLGNEQSSHASIFKFGIKSSHRRISLSLVVSDKLCMECVCVCNLLICGLFERRWHTHTHNHIPMLKCTPIHRIFLCLASSKCKWIALSRFNLEFSSVLPALSSYTNSSFSTLIHVLLHQQALHLLFTGVHAIYVTYNLDIHSIVVLQFLIQKQNVVTVFIFSIPNSTHLTAIGYKYYII
jgi:hypothetical protein